MSDTATTPGQPTATGIETRPEPAGAVEHMERPVIHEATPFVNVTPDAAHVLVETLFAGSHQKIRGVQYAIAYELADGRSGGDIVDVFHYDNDSVSVAVADIAGKGTQAAIHAAMIKYGLRAFASNGMVPEAVVRGLDRLYLENNAFEGTTESFATLFFGIIDATRRFLHYTNAGHEPVMLLSPSGEAELLPPCAPIVGVFDNQQHLFKQSVAAVESGTILVATTDGVTEARNEAGEQFGTQRMMDLVGERREATEPDIAEALLTAVEGFALGKRRDDIAILVMRFL